MVGILMGSKSDLEVVRNAFDVLDSFGVPFTARILSAHRTPAEAADFADNAEKNGIKVIICAAGMAVSDDELAAKLDQARVDMAEQVAAKETKLQAELI